MDSTDIIYETFMKKSSLYRTQMRKRWMVLKGHSLYFYKNKQNYKHPTEIIDLKIYDKVQQSSNWIEYDTKITFELISTQAVQSRRVLAAESNEKMINWINHIGKIQRFYKKVPYTQRTFKPFDIEEWKKLPSVPFNVLLQPIYLNTSEILIFSWVKKKVYKYSIHDTKWDEWIDYPLNFPVDNNCMLSFDQKNNLLYGVTDSGIFTLNTEIIEWKEYLKQKICKKLQMEWEWRFSASDTGSCHCIATDGTLHIFGNKTHYIWVDNKIVSVIKLKFEWNARDTSVFYIENRQMLLLIKKSLIYQYNILEFKWENLKIQFPTELTFYSGSILINDQYIISFDIGRYISWNQPQTNSIYIIDCDKLVVKKSNIESHMKQIKYVCLAEDDLMIYVLLINGFIKQFCKSDIRRYPSNDVIMMIYSYYKMQSIHVFGTGKFNNHMKISVEQLLWSNCIQTIEN
eukprot:83978_1